MRASQTLLPFQAPSTLSFALNIRSSVRQQRNSVLLFTYVHRDVLDQPQRFFGAEKLTSRLRSYGEPWTFGLYPQEIEGHLAARGSRLMKDLSVAEVLAKGRSA